MSKDEFVELHGENLWTELVKPLQESVCTCEICTVRRKNANILIHAELILKSGLQTQNPG